MARPSRGFSESIGIWKCRFLRRGENRSTRRKTSRSKDENQQQTQPTFDAESGNRTRATLVGGLRGRQMLNHCAIPALWQDLSSLWQNIPILISFICIKLRDTCTEKSSEKLKVLHYISPYILTNNRSQYSP